MLSSFSTSFLDTKRTSSSQMYIKKDKTHKSERREKLMNTKAVLVKGTIFKSRDQSTLKRECTSDQTQE